MSIGEVIIYLGLGYCFYRCVITWVNIRDYKDGLKVLAITWGLIIIGLLMMD